MQQLERLRPATDLLGDADGLRARLVEDGYLYLPGLLPRDRVLGVRHDILRELAEAGWLDQGADPLEARPGPMRTDRDPDWWEGYTRVLAVESFNALPHDERILAVVRAILGDRTFVHPQKIARVTFPGSAYPTPPHQDYLFIQGSGDTLTTWIPLGDCSRELGGLRVLAGSHREGLRPVRGAVGMGNLTIEGVDADDPRWRGIDRYEAGDVLLFHSLTVHEAPANDGDRMRLSGDFRFQSADDPIDAGALMPTAHGAHGRSWWNLTKDWADKRWCLTGQPIHLAGQDTDPHATPPSRLV